MPVLHIKAFTTLIIVNQLQFLIFFIIQHFFCLLDGAFLFQHQDSSVDCFNVFINGATLGINTTGFQITHNVIGCDKMVFIRLFHKVLQNNIRLHLLV